jgi:hypothetical protein
MCASRCQSARMRQMRAERNLASSAIRQACCAPTWSSSGRTGVRAIAVSPLRVRNCRHHSEHAFIGTPRTLTRSIGGDCDNLSLAAFALLCSVEVSCNRTRAGMDQWTAVHLRRRLLTPKMKLLPATKSLPRGGRSFLTWKSLALMQHPRGWFSPDYKGSKENVSNVEISYNWNSMLVGPEMRTVSAIKAQRPRPSSELVPFRLEPSESGGAVARALISPAHRRQQHHAHQPL